MTARERQADGRPMQLSVEQRAGVDGPRAFSPHCSLGYPSASSADPALSCP